MTTFFVSRHSGAIEWARLQGLDAEPCPHLDVARLQAGDQVIGVLPAHLAAQVHAAGARYFHLAMDVPAERRGQEMSAVEMTACGARLVEIECRIIAPGRTEFPLAERK